MMDKRLLALVPEALRHVLATVVWQWVGLLGNAAVVWVIARVLAALAVGGTVPASALTMLACGIVARAISARLASRESFIASQGVKKTLRRRIYEKLLALGPDYVEAVPTAEVVQLSVEGCEQLETYFGQYLPQLFYAVLAPVTLFFMVVPVCLPAAVVLLLCVPLIPVTIVAVQKVAKRILGDYWDQYAELGDSFLENLQGLTTLKIYQADAARHEAMNAEAERFRVVTMKVLSMQLNSIIVMDIVALGGAVAGMAVALAYAAAGAVDLFGCLFIILISADFFLPMRQLGSYFHVAMNGIAASEKIFRLLGLPDPAPRPLLPERGDHFSMGRASFSYEEGRLVLDKVDIDVPSVGLTAIVGESGSGKSTVAALLSGRYDGYEGNVFLGGKQVRDIDRAALARYVTVVGLQARLFCGDGRGQSSHGGARRDRRGAVAGARARAPRGLPARAGRPDHKACGKRCQPLGRPASAPEPRARRPAQQPRLHLRRGHEQRGRRVRARHHGRHLRPCAVQGRRRDLAPPGKRRACPPHLRPRPWRARRRWHARGAFGRMRGLRRAVERTVRAGEAVGGRCRHGCRRRFRGGGYR